ncbi:MAG: alkaline phosphatase family protein [Thermoanaerobaculia bacterium]
MTIRWAYLKRVLAGAIFGLYITNLLYFLNPQIDITPGRLAAVTIVYGLICGLLFGSALWLLRALRVRLFGKPKTDGGFRPHGFGFVVLAAFLAAAIYWMHLEVFRIYLPIGAWRLLSKATNLITATAFVLLLIWFAERNADRRTSRILFVIGVIVIAISSFFLYQRRDSYRTEEHAVVVADIGTVAGQRPVIVVAIRNLPYDWILTLAGEGSLPFFEQTRTRGYFTRLEPFPTTSPKSLWASLATGKLPFRHGVTGKLGYQTPLNRRGERFLIIPAGVGFKVWGLIPPVDRISTPLPSGLSLPLWTLFERLGLHAAVIGWPWSEPAGAARVVTDRYFENPTRKPADVLPPQFAAEIARLETAPTDADTQRFNGTGNARQRIVAGLSADLTSMAILRNSAPSFPLTICTLGGFEQAQRAIHIFNNELPSRSTVKGLVLRAYAEQLDRMLSALVRDYPNHMIVVVSPSGPVPPQLPATPYALLHDFVDPADPSADDGFVIIRGDGVVHRDKPQSAMAVDVVPTVLYLAGLPIGRDMDGSVLSEAFSEELLRKNPLSLVQTYEAQRLVVRRSGM